MSDLTWDSGQVTWDTDQVTWDGWQAAGIGTLRFSVTHQYNDLTDVITQAGATAYLLIYSGTTPVNCAAAATGTLMVSLPCSNPIGTVPFGGVLRFSAITPAACAANNTAGYFRLCTSSAGTTCIAQGTVGTGTSDLNFLAGTTWPVGLIIVIPSFIIVTNDASFDAGLGVPGITESLDAVAATGTAVPPLATGTAAITEAHDTPVGTGAATSAGIGTAAITEGHDTPVGTGAGVGAGAPGQVTGLEMAFQGMLAAGGGHSGGAPVPTAPNTQAIKWTQGATGAFPITQNNVYRNTNGAGYVLLPGMPIAATTSFTDTNAALCVGNAATPHNSVGQAWAANGYLYKVSAIDSQGTEGPLSDPQIFVFYRNGVQNGTGGDVNNAVTSTYNDTTGASGSPIGSTQVCLNTVNSAFGDWLPYAGNNATQWNIWCGFGSPAQVYAYLNITLKPGVSNSQTWNCWAEYRTDTNTDPTGSTPGVTGIGNASAVYGPQAVLNVWNTYKLPLSLLMKTAVSDYGGITGGMFYKLGLADQTGLAANHYWIDNAYFSVS